MNQMNQTEASRQGITEPYLARIPPHDDEAELAILGCIILRNEILDIVSDIIRPSDFYNEAHSEIFQAQIDLVEHRTPIDLLTLAKTLRWKGTLASVGGAAYLSSLLDRVVTTAHFKAYAETIRDLARVRRMLTAALEILDRGYGDFGEVEDFVQRSEAAVLRAAQSRRVSSVSKLGHEVRTLYDELAGIQSGEETEAADLGILTGIPSLDRILSGLQPDEVTVIAGASSMGKTALALQFADYCSLPTLMFSLEQPKRQLAYRILAAHSGVPIEILRRPKEWTADAQRNIQQAAVRIYGRKIFVDDRGGLSTDKIRSAARRQARENGIGMVIVDYLGLIKQRSDGKQTIREREIAAAMEDAKLLAKELHIPVVILCQMNRDYKQRSDPRPQLEDLRESGAIGHIADTVIFPWRRELLKPPNKRVVNRHGLEASEIVIAKNRNGRVGDVLAWWDGRRMRYKERSPEEVLPTETTAFEDDEFDIPVDGG